MALVDYGSDSDDSGNEDQQPTVAAPPPPLPSARAQPAKPKATPAAAPPPPPRPAQPAYSTTSGLALPPPKVASRKRIAPKFTLEPTSSIPADEGSASSSSLEPPVKKAKVAPPPGSGSSALLSMLPAPKLALPKEKAMPKPVVLKPLEVGADGRIDSFAFERDGQDADEEEPVAIDFSRKAGPSGTDAKKEEMKIVKPLDWKLKSVVAEKKAPVVMDFFGMGTTPAPTTSTPSASSSSLTPSAAPSSSSISITSAPVVPTFVPPEPTQEDPYPGYYLHPKTKSWAAYEPEYYNSFWAAWKEEEKRSTEGKEGKGWKGLDSGMGDVSEFKVADQGLGAGGSGTGVAAAALDAPAVKKSYSKHASKNQLSSLISDAQSNRSKLEEQIATAKRNKRAAGQAYGF